MILKIKNLPVKILIVGVIKKGYSILMRNKFPGAGPYIETWYSFSADFVSGKEPSIVFKEYIKDFIGIDILPIKYLFWDTEVKKDYDGVKKQFIYLNIEFKYISGNILVPKDLKGIEWVSLKKLSSLDIVPPFVVLFKKLKYLK
ncbi:MAG: hypothetical protein PHF88_00115 [Candidatus Pacebacteria bacterium]|nr:hypothetical protein [Candidatus Paceibacterota bacterium]